MRISWTTSSCRRGLSAALVVAALSGCGSARAPSVVPWINQPLPLYRIPGAKLLRYPTTAARCRAGHLRVTQGRTGAGLGNYLEELVFTNTGGSTCLLRGYPTVVARSVTLHPLLRGTYFGQLVASDVRPGGHAYLDLATGDGCQGGRKPVTRYRGLSFVLPGGGTVAAPAVSIIDQCGLSMSEFGLPERWVEPQPRAGTIEALHASIALPSVVAAGAVLQFVATLANPTANAISLRPCPGYTEEISTPHADERASYRLNCGDTQSIDAHGRIRFAMALHVPLRAAEGFAEVAWSLDTPSGPVTAGDLRVMR